MSEQNTSTSDVADPAPEVEDDANRKHRGGIKDLASRLYQGDAGVDVVGKRKIFYGVAAAIVLIAVVTILVRPFNLGIEFRGGNSFTVPASVGTIQDVRDTISGTGAAVASAQNVGGKEPSYLIKTAELSSDPTVAADKATQIKTLLASKYKIPVAKISANAVSGAWGASVTRQALIGTLVFLVAVVIYLSLVFREWKMAAAALIALLQNLFLTATVYLLLGFEVTPSTVIGFLTILGFALYDVVVVFDKVRENTRGITGNPNRTYGEAANLAVNQTIMRSINTAIVALLPVGGLLFIGAGLLGAGTLKDIGLVLFVGMLAAVYSSIFLATPVLVDLKEQEPRFKMHRQRVLQRRAAGLTGRATERKAKVAVRQSTGTTVTSSSSAAVDTVPDRQDTALAGAAPRTGARPQQPRKRPGSGSKPGGGKAGGSRSRKR
jgi:preprotein translocase subunit SecF